MQKKILFSVVAGFLLGFVWLVALRFFTYENTSVHYHANFALYVDGAQDKFDNFTFYEEVQSCGSDDVNNPRTRVHLHGEVASVVHVHDAAVTWGHFFANLGYTLGDEVLKNDDGVFADGAGGNQLTFTLNGKAVDGIANRAIASEDRLLVNYGKESSATLKSRYDAIPKDAGEYNQRPDPASCSGSEAAGFWTRLTNAVGI